VGMIGLGKMGANMTMRLLRGGHRMVVHDRNRAVMEAVAKNGAPAVQSLSELLEQLRPPRAVWIMVPAGDPTEQTIAQLGAVLQPGDAIIDGGNSYYQDSIRRAALLRERGLHFVDVGTSGGIWGVTEGYSLMIGGEQDVVSRLRPLFETLAPAVDKGWGYAGPHGAGHFVKMVHNGIEYGLMQAYAEGFELMQHKTDFGLDLHQIAEIWRYGSVVRSWLLDLTATALEDNPSLAGIATDVPDSGEGRWTVAEAIELNCAIPVITMSLQRRFRSRELEPFGDKLLAALRNQFGDHAITHAPDARERTTE
jgi:6-phosphogluconate dehydrogenase